eukprot:TRINITY_DN1088_c0_g2_i3.p1 TRINITY_DN1088_c0_g2~~TRINITY_DN1088_c0_g2_i3.p1  ORF type:complete len:224 (-),score=37.31 TRINITY_DN1088_c0_g2_i3:365-1036(-)
MAARFSSILLLGCGLSVSCVSADPTCPPANFSTVDNFDLDTFISKRWWAQQQMPTKYLPETQNRCVYAEYKKRTPGLLGYDVAVHNHAEYVAPPHKVQDSGSMICAKIVDQAHGKLEVAPCFLPPSLAAGPYWVVAYSESEGYALVSGGSPTQSAPDGCRTGTGVNNAGLWIFTRQQSKDQQLVTKVRGLAQAKGFDLSVLKDVDNSECTDPPSDEKREAVVV